MTAKEYQKKGEAFRKAGKFEEAHTCYNKAIEIAPNVSAFHHGKGNVFWQQQNFKEALIAYNKAIEINPNIGAFYYGRGNVLWKQQKHEKALSAYDKAIKLSPLTASPAYNGKGNVFWELKKYEKAHAAFDRAIKLSPNKMFSYNGKGVVYREQGEYEESHKFFNQAIELAPQNEAPYNGKGNTFRLQKKYNEAHIFFDKAINLNPNYAAPHHGKVQVYLAQLNKQASVQHLNRWTILAGYEWLTGASSIFPLAPFFTLKFINSYSIPPWANSKNHQTALKTAIPFKALQAYQKEDNPLSKTKEALFNFYLGDQPASLQLFQEQLASQEGPTLQVCYYALRSSAVCITPLPEELSSKAEKAAINKVPEQTKGFLSFLKGKSTKLPPSEVKELYYAGLLLLDIDRNEEALPCFERIALQFPPARLASIKLKFDLGKTKQAEKELASFVTDHEAMNNIGRGLRKEFINPDIPLAEYLQRYAYHDELREAAHFLSLRSRRFPNRIPDGAKLGFFFEVFTFDTPGLNKIYQFFRTTYLKNFYQTYYLDELQPVTREAFTEGTIDDINRAIAKQPHSRAKEILERLEGLPKEENRPRAIAGYFDTEELDPERALLLNNYFFVNGQSNTYDKWKLDFYITEKATRSGWQPSKSLEGGTKGALKKLLENPIGTIGETLAVLGSAALGTSIIGSVLIAIGTKFSSSFLAELLLQYLKSSKTNFKSYADFEVSFEVYIAEQRDILGANGFRKRFPLEVLQG